MTDSNLGLGKLVGVCHIRVGLFCEGTSNILVSVDAAFSCDSAVFDAVVDWIESRPLTAGAGDAGFGSFGTSAISTGLTRDPVASSLPLFDAGDNSVLTVA